MRDITVLHVVRRAEGGMLKHVSTILSLMRGEIRHVLAAPKEFFEALPESARDGVQLVPINIGDSVGLQTFRQARTISGEAKRVGADIVHCHGYKAAIPGVIGARLAGKKSVITGHNLFPSNASRAAKLSLNFVARLTNTIIAVSPSLKDSMISAGVDGSKIDVIPNGVDLSLYRHAAKQSIRDEINPGSDARIVFCAARLTEIKGVKYLIEAAALLSNRIPNMKVVIAGDGPDAAELKRLADEIAPESVKFLGQRNDIPDLLAVADVVVIPSLAEGQSLVLVESMASAKPVVASRVGGMADAIRSGENGLLVPPADPKLLADAVVSVLESRDLSARLSESALKYAIENFDINSMIVKTKEKYLCLVS